jgi:hypothetical protein
VGIEIHISNGACYNSSRVDHTPALIYYGQRAHMCNKVQFSFELLPTFGFTSHHTFLGHQFNLYSINYETKKYAIRNITSKVFSSPNLRSKVFFGKMMKLNKKYWLTKWNIICGPKDLGGLGLEVLELNIDMY